MNLKEAHYYCFTCVWRPYCGGCFKALNCHHYTKEEAVAKLFPEVYTGGRIGVWQKTLCLKVLGGEGGKIHERLGKAYLSFYWMGWCVSW